MKVTKEKVLSDFKYFKDKAIKTFYKNNIELSIKYIEAAANLMYHFNFSYTDYELEELIEKISIKLFNKENNKKNKYDYKKIVFYDSFALDNRGLTEQYLRALLELEYTIIFITTQKYDEKMKNISKLLLRNKENQIYKLTVKNQIERAQQIKNIIEKSNATKIFNHLSPDDIPIMIALESLNIERYQINLTDHAFWLGKHCNDYFLEFRSYGKNISITQRGIDENRSIILPYYPITNSDEHFKGFDFDIENKKLIFSGGQLYKIYGSEIYFEIVKYILDTYSDTVFLFLGNGDDKPLKKFIEKNKYENRFYHFNERRDINEVFKKCYFYLGTYPIGGSLMTQFAVINKKIPLTYTDIKHKISDQNEIFIKLKDIKITYYELEDLKSEIRKIMESNEYYDAQRKKLEGVIIKEEEFKTELKKIITTKKSSYEYKKYDIDTEAVSQLYLLQENNYLKQYRKLSHKKKIKLFFKELL